MLPAILPVRIPNSLPHCLTAVPGDCAITFDRQPLTATKNIRPN